MCVCGVCLIRWGDDSRSALPSQLLSQIGALYTHVPPASCPSYITYSVQQRTGANATPTLKAHSVWGLEGRKGSLSGCCALRMRLPVGKRPRGRRVSFSSSSLACLEASKCKGLQELVLRMRKLLTCVAKGKWELSPQRCSEEQGSVIKMHGGDPQ